MGVVVDIVRVACQTSGATTTQDITGSLGGLPAKAALFIATWATSNGVAANNVSISYGAATGATNRWAVGAIDEDGQPTSVSQSHYHTDRCVSIYDPTTQVEDGNADFDSFITNGVRIDWSNYPTSAHLLTVVLFAGSDLSAHANIFDIANTQDNTIDITSPGFEPDVLFTAMAFSLANPGTANSLKLSLGLVHNDGAGGITQRSGAWTSQNGAGTSRSSGHGRSDGGIIECLLNSGILDWYGDFHTFDASGFSCSARNAGGNNREVCYLALSLGGAVSSWVGTYSTPTSTGNDSETGPGFTPQTVFNIQTFFEAFATAYSNNIGGTFGAAGFTSSNEYANSVSFEDAQLTTDTQSLSSSAAVELPDDDGTAGVTASFVSMDANGWTLNYSVVEANAKLFLALAIEEEAVVAGWIPKISQRHPMKNPLLRL